MYVARSYQQNPKVAENFIRKFKMETQSYYSEFLYNADERGLIWKALPTTLVSKMEFSASGHKVSKDCLTLLNCANSIGNHKIPLLLIDKSKTSRAFKNMKKLSLFYKNQSRPR